VSALGEINLKGISSVKNMTTVLAILESPDRVVPAEELEKEKKEESDEEG
jgi:hypothetical protein